MKHSKAEFPIAGRKLSGIYLLQLVCQVIKLALSARELQRAKLNL